MFEDRTDLLRDYIERLSGLLAEDWSENENLDKLETELDAFEQDGTMARRAVAVVMGISAHRDFAAAA